MSNTENLNTRELVNQYQLNGERMREIANRCENKKRTPTDAEKTEFRNLAMQNDVLYMRMRAETATHAAKHPNAKREAEKMIRENARKKRPTEISLVRDIMVVDDATPGGIVPLDVEDIIKPLAEGFILDKVGLPFRTGLAGDFIWPIYEQAFATVLGETERLESSDVPLSKLTAQPARIGIAIPVSNEALDNTDGLLEMIIRDVMPDAIRVLLNKIICSTEYYNETARVAGLAGPFVKAFEKKNFVELDEVPTFDQLNKKMKSELLSTGVSGDHLCWVMSKPMAATFEGTPISKDGIFVPIMQDGKIAGIPVYTTNEISRVTRHYFTGWEDNAPRTAFGDLYDEPYDPNYIITSLSFEEAYEKCKRINPMKGEKIELRLRTEFIGLGDWRYQPMGMFGDSKFIVDPYSQARKNAVDFVLNSNYGTTTLRDEAFMLGKVIPGRKGGSAVKSPYSDVNPSPSAAGKKKSK